MKIFRTAKALQKWRAQIPPRKSLGFVPTMGCLHEGHLDLVRRSQKECDKSLVSIFVNPTQFGKGEDFEAYPRTEKEDLKLLRECKVEAVFIPKSPQEIYPLKSSFEIKAPKEFSETMEGKYRPGHFDGVASVVFRLFSISRPDRAFFGEKDFQQLQLIRFLVKDFQLPVVIRAVPTRREESGLALSSRNHYFNPVQREEAAYLHECLQSSNDLAEAKQRLMTRGFQVEYLESWKEDLSFPTRDYPQRWLVAARFHGVRLIDNLLKKN